MEKTTLIGLVAGLILIFGSVMMGDGWITFFDPVSIVLVLGGTVAALMVSFPIDELKVIPGLFKESLTFQEPDLQSYVKEFYELSRTARREGLLALDRRLAEVEDPLARFGLEMAVDGIEETEICNLMDERIGSEMKMRQIGPKFMNNAGGFAPAFGMLGTLIGLIQMLNNLADPSQIGSGMAVALVTTFWGAILANLFFLPLAVKMKTQISIHLKARMMVRTGVLAIVRGDSPSMIEKRLLMFINGEAPKETHVEETKPLSKAA